MGSMAQWDQWHNGFNNTMSSQWIQWHDGINDTMEAQCRNRFNGKIGLMAQWGQWQSRSDGINGTIETSESGKVYTF